MTILTFPKRPPPKADPASAEAKACQEASRPELIAHFSEIFYKALSDTAHLSRLEIAEALATETVAWIEGYDEFLRADDKLTEQSSP